MSDGRSPPKHTLEQGLGRLSVPGSHRPSLEPPAASLPPAELLQTVRGGSSRAGMRAEESELGGRGGGEKKTGIQGAAPQPLPVCQSVWWGEERGKGKLEGGDGTNALFRAKSKAYHVCRLPPTEMPLRCPASPKWATTARQRSSSQQAARQDTTATPRNQNQNK